jgi:hypothetical protein
MRMTLVLHILAGGLALGAGYVAGLLDLAFGFDALSHGGSSPVALPATALQAE